MQSGWLQVSQPLQGCAASSWFALIHISAVVILCFLSTITTALEYTLDVQTQYYDRETRELCSNYSTANPANSTVGELGDGFVKADAISLSPLLNSVDDYDIGVSYVGSGDQPALQLNVDQNGTTRVPCTDDVS